MPVIPVIVAAAAVVGSTATAAAGAVAAGAAAAGGAVAAGGAAAAAAAGSAAAGAAAIAGTTAGTIAVTTVGTGVVAAGAAKAKSAYDEKKIEEGYRIGEREATAKYTIKLQNIVTSLEAARSSMANIQDYYSLILALTAVGLATASADGKISQEEIEDLDQFTLGISRAGLPQNILDSIITLKSNPPNFNTAIQYVKKLNSVDNQLFESLIDVVANSDGEFCDKERAFLEAFRASA